MEATKQMAKSKAPFRYSPQLVVLRSSRNPVTMVSQVSAKIQACITEAQHMTNAILAYENYAEDGRIPPINEYTDATRQNMKFILGEEKNKRNGEQMPVLFNAANMNPQGEILDPWHRPYRVRIVESKVNPKDQGNNTQIRSFAMFPNYNRRPASEVEAENE